MQEGDDPGILCTLLAVKHTRIKKVTAVYSLYELELSPPGARRQWKERNGFENLSVKNALFIQGLSWIKKVKLPKITLLFIPKFLWYCYSQVKSRSYRQQIDRWFCDCVWFCNNWDIPFHSYNLQLQGVHRCLVMHEESQIYIYI